MKRKFKRFDPVYIEWIDAGGLNNDGWHNIFDNDEEPEPTICKSLGFYLTTTKEYFYICQNYNQTNPTACTNIERVPNVCIKFSKKLKF